MSAQWERVREGDFDYGGGWDYAHDGYLRVYVHRRIVNQCERCNCSYSHFFVSHADWLKVPLKWRSMKLCVDCYASVS